MAERRSPWHGLKPKDADCLRRAMQLVESGEHLLSGQLLLALANAAPDHPEVLRWRGRRHAAVREWSAAASCLSRAAELRPNDFDLWMRLGAAEEQAEAFGSAAQSLRSAMRCAGGSKDWLRLSLAFDRQGCYDESLAAIEQVLRLEPVSETSLLQRARCLKALGKAREAADDYRTLIAIGPPAARAWFALLDLKTVALSRGEVEQLERAASLPSLAADDRLLLDFALGKALEDAGQLDRAFAAFQRANLAAQPAHPWNAPDFARQVASVRSAFELGPRARARPQGAEIIFLVGLPRSGTTLVEQVLASHSRVEGAGELPYLSLVIEDESKRRGQPFPSWVGTASADDWTRLGQHYLRLSARWRIAKPSSTDKLPENWLLAGAALAMLPAARIVDCRRDALETCWSCYKQLFGPGRAGFAYEFSSLGAYWQAYDGLCRFWAQKFAQHFRSQQHEALVADPKNQIRSLLEFCDLSFEPACLQFHTAPRAIRTPSALQVRQPLRAASKSAEHYGALLDPLRRHLEPDNER